MAEYNDDNITTLEWDEHIRTRPGMYIGKLGDGSAHDDGIYVLFKEVIDNAIDEFMQGFGKTIEISIKENKVSIRDYGRGIPLTKVVDCVSKMNTGGKFKEGTAFDNSIGMNGVGVKAVNALSTYFSYRVSATGKRKPPSSPAANWWKNPPCNFAKSATAPSSLSSPMAVFSKTITGTSTMWKR